MFDNLLLLYAEVHSVAAIKSLKKRRNKFFRMYLSEARQVAKDRFGRVAFIGKTLGYCKKGFSRYLFTSVEATICMNK